MCRNHRRNCRAGLGRNGKVAPSSLFLSSAFSVNTLTLFGHILAVGIVVDDAIVVAEALQHHLEHGLSPREATVKAMKEVSGSVIMIALVLCAVFVPVAFMGGVTGQLISSLLLPSRWLSSSPNQRAHTKPTRPLDREKARAFGVKVKSVFQTSQAYLSED
jgi:multidrug efflux pump subunit AcrB